MWKNKFESQLNIKNRIKIIRLFMHNKINILLSVLICLNDLKIFFPKY